MPHRRHPNRFCGGEEIPVGVPELATIITDRQDVSYRIVPGFPYYAVGDDGTVWGCRGRDGKRLGYWKKMALVTMPPRHERLYVGFRRDGKQHVVQVATVVLTAFVGPCPDEMAAIPVRGGQTMQRKRVRAGETQKAVGADYGHHQPHIGKIMRGEIWSFVDDG